MTGKMFSSWSTAAIVLAFWAGCATDGTQTRTPAEKPTQKPAPAAETSPEETRKVSEKYGLTGYAVYEVDDRLWVFEAGSEGLVQFVTDGEFAKSISLIGEGPDGRTIRSVDKATATAYIAAWKAR